MIKYSGIYESSTPPPSTKSLWVDGGVLKIYKNGSWKPVDDPKSKLTIDSILKAGSTNPVENKAIYGRFLGVDKDIEVNKNNINVLTGRVNEVDGVAKGAEALAKVNEKRINSVEATANANKDRSQQNASRIQTLSYNLADVKNTADGNKHDIESLTDRVIKPLESKVSQLQELNVVYPNNIRTLTTESTVAEIKEAFTPAIGGTAGERNTPHVGYLIKGNSNSDNQDDPDSTIISVEIVKIDDKDCHKFMYIDNNRDLVTMTVYLAGLTDCKVIERSVVSNIDTIIDKTPYTFDGRLCVLEKGDDISECLIPENMSQSVTPRVGDNIRLNRYYDTPSESPSWAIITGVQQSGNKIMVSASSVDATFKFSYNATTYEVITPWTEIHGSKNIYNTDLLLSLSTTDEATIKKALTPKGCDYPVMPISGDIAESTDSFNSVIITIDSGDESLIFLPTPYYNNLIYAISIRKDYTSAEQKAIITRTYRVCYDGQGLSDTSVKDSATIKALYTPLNETDGTPDIEGPRAPRIGDLINMGDGNMGVVSEAIAKGNTYITRWFYGGKLYEVVVSQDFTSIPEYRKVIYDTTSGTLRDLYISAGAKYNEATGFYELNGLTDITEEQMSVIWQEDLSGWYLKGRTNLTRNISTRGDAGGYNSGIDICNMCHNNNNITIFNFGQPPLVRYIDNAFSGCTKLETIDTRFPITPYGGVVGSNAFRDCSALKEVRFNMRYIGYSVNVKFPASSLISKDSVLSIIKTTKTEGSVKPLVVVGLNEAAYNRLKDDTDITAALTEKNGFVTLTQI